MQENNCLKLPQIINTIKEEIIKIYLYITILYTKCLLIMANFGITTIYAFQSVLFNGIVHNRHQDRKTAVLICHRCIIKLVLKNERLNIG